MTLDPQAAAVVEALGRRPGARAADEVTVSEARARTRGLIGLQAAPQPVAMVQGAVVPGSGRRARVYYPAGEAPFGCLVLLHGGGWVTGDLDTHDRPARRLANASGCAVVTVDYRRAPEHPFPVPLDDCLEAIRWVGRESGRLGIDPSRIGVAGDSAGGNLAAAACLRARDEGGPDVAFQALIYPVTDAACATSSYDAYRTGYGLRRDTMTWYWKHYLGGGADGAHPYASPLRAADLSGLPPAFVATAECDPVRDDGELYAARLAEAGVPVTHRRYSGMIHAFFLMDGVLDRTAVLIEETAREAARTLMPSNPPL
ncbi:alpha/beta hydrolase [Actinomadura sp. WMMA1423]|uniref:alpha/beta hydrolase n=1 Tax=Actinomadura sp. WMMA1423 TaxID=2591108 RepID=UPI00114659BD|nr:alpha/beta hydrolase [Actinomadura sp. WMMA1423]